MNSQVQLRAAAPEDLKAILAVQTACADAPQWSTAQCRELLKPHDAAGRGRLTLIAEQEEAIIGYAVASSVADEAELENIAVSPQARRQGIATALCDAVLHWAKTTGANEMLLEVRASNEAAQALYGRLGFAKAGIRRNYYANPQEDALLMRANLLQGQHL